MMRLRFLWDNPYTRWARARWLDAPADGAEIGEPVPNLVYGKKRVRMKVQWMSSRVIAPSCACGRPYPNFTTVSEIIERSRASGAAAEMTERVPKIESTTLRQFPVLEKGTILLGGDEMAPGSPLWAFARSAWRGTTACGRDCLIGVSFSLPDGLIVRLKMDHENARSVVQTLTEILGTHIVTCSQSDSSSGKLSVDGSIPLDGQSQ